MSLDLYVAKAQWKSTVFQNPNTARLSIDLGRTEIKSNIILSLHFKHTVLIYYWEEGQTMISD